MASCLINKKEGMTYEKMVLALGILGISSLGVPVTGLAAEANPSTSMTSEASLTINPGFCPLIVFQILILVLGISQISLNKRK